MLWNVLKVFQFIALASNNCIHINKRFSFKFYFENHKAKHALIILSRNEIKCINKVGGWGELLPIFMDLVSTNILLAMLGFPLSKKINADFCFKPSGLFFYFFWWSTLRTFPVKKYLMGGPATIVKALGDGIRVVFASFFTLYRCENVFIWWGIE